jgi:hypothetical protein
VVGPLLGGAGADVGAGVAGSGGRADSVVGPVGPVGLGGAVASPMPADAGRMAGAMPDVALGDEGGGKVETAPTSGNFGGGGTERDIDGLDGAIGSAAGLTLPNPAEEEARGPEPSVLAPAAGAETGGVIEAGVMAGGVEAGGVTLGSAPLDAAPPTPVAPPAGVRPVCCTPRGGVSQLDGGAVAGALPTASAPGAAGVELLAAPPGVPVREKVESGL